MRESCTVTSGSPITVTAGETRTGIDFALALGGRICGTVTDAASPTPNPLPDVRVYVYDSQGRNVTSGRTDGAGHYTSDGGLPAGTYYARAQNWSGYVNELYNDIPCVSCTVTNGSPITVTLGETRSGIDFALASGGRISGTVTDTASPTPNPLPDIEVVVYDPDGRSVAWGYTDAAGYYTSDTGLLAGTYFVRTYNSSGYVDELYNDIPCASCTVTNGTPITVTLGETRSGIDFALALGGRISGTVTDTASPTPNPLPGVSVSVHDSQGRNVASGRTDGAGHYTSDGGLPAGSYYVRTYNSSGYLNELYHDILCTSCTVTNGTPVSVALGETTSGIDFALSQGGRISGTVTDATGLPLQNVDVQVYDSQRNYVTGERTDSDGHYTTTSGLLAGSYYARTYNSASYVDELYEDIPCAQCVVTSGTPIPVALGTTTSGIDFALALGGRISGRVTDSETGLRLSGISVSVYGATGTQVTSGSTDSSGAYTTSAGLPAGTYFARAQGGSYAPELYQEIACLTCEVRSGTPIGVSLGVTTPGIDFTLTRGGRITGTVRDEDSGNPIPNAGVRVMIENRTLWAGADSSGNYAMDGLPTGTYHVFTSVGGSYIDELYDDIPSGGSTWGGGSSGTPVPVTGGETTAGIDFALGRGGNVQGRITDASSGVPLAGIGVSVSGGWVSTASDASGSYTVTRVVPGSSAISTSNATGYLDEFYDDVPSEIHATSATIVKGETVTVDFALEAGGRISGTVTDAATGLPLEGVRVYVYSRNGSSETSGATDASGAYRSDTGLPPGRYYLRTENSLGYVNECAGDVACPWKEEYNYVTRGTPIAVAAGQTTTGVDFALSRGGRIAGYVVDAISGAPLSASLSFFDDQNRVVATASAPSNTGRYVSGAGLPEGTYYVVARASRNLPMIYDSIVEARCSQDPGPDAGMRCDATAGQGVAVTAGATTDGIDFALGHGGGRIMGAMREAGSLRGLPGSMIHIFDASGALVGAGYTDFTGSYDSGSELPAGTYFVKSFNWKGLTDVTYGTNIPCGHDCVPVAATPVVVGSGVTPVDFVLERNARISGHVTDASGAPVVGMEIEIYDSSGTRVTSSFHDRTGEYWSAPSLRDGTYYAKTDSRSELLNQVYGGIECSLTCNPLEGTPIVISGGVDATGIDFVLSTPTLSIDDVAVVEGNSGTKTATFTVALSRVSHKTVTVRYETANGTATTADGDYDSASGTLSFAPGVTTQTVSVTVRGDLRNEAEETFSVNLSSAGWAGIADPQGTGTVTNDDPLPALSINDVSVLEGDAGPTQARFTVTLAAVSGQWVTVDYATTSGTATTGDSDYLAALGTLTFAAGVVSQDVSVNVTGDTKHEPNETFALSLSNASRATIADGDGVGTILDDDPPPSLSLNDVGITEGNEGQKTMTFTVTLSAVSGRTVLVGYACVGGTATAADGDYGCVADTLAIPAGSTTGTIEVTVNGDTKYEGDEVFSVVLDSPLNATIADGTGLGTITDDDATPSLTIGDASVLEGSSGPATITFTVTLSGVSGQPVSVSYATADGTATTADGDYLAKNNVLAFNPGVPSRTISVTVNGDTRSEGNETFSVSLSSPSGASIEDGVGTGTIVDDDTTRELSHGSAEMQDLAAQAGPLADVDDYHLAQEARSSYEVVVDAVSGDVQPLALMRLAADGATVLASSVAVGTGSSRSLRWENPLSTPVTDERIRLRSGGCTTTCGADDVYRIRAYDTTYAIPRFNNTGTQVSVVMLQNPASYAIGGTLYFWSGPGVLLHAQPFSIAAKGGYTFNTSSVPALQEKGGTVTITNDGGYGDLAGKGVALEPASGMSFDSPMVWRPIR